MRPTKLLVYAVLLLAGNSVVAAQSDRWESAIQEFEKRDKSDPPP